MRAPRRSTLLALAASLLAFLLLGGTALALSSHKSATKPPAYQVRCTNGAVKAIAVVVADQNKGFQKDYTTDSTFFKSRWSCNAKAVFQARRFDRGVYDIRVVGNAGQTPIIAPLGGPVKSSVSPLPDGGYRVTLIGDGPGNGAVDENFVLVLL